VEDSRFSEVYNDPRFMRVPKKVKQVEIDSRFKKALKSKEFNLVQKVDKYGKRVDKQDNTMQAFYKMKEESESEEGAPAKKGAANKYYDDDGKFKWEAQSSSDEEEEPSEAESEEITDLKPSKRELDSEDEDIGIDFEDDETTKAMQPKLVDEDEVQIGRRLALTNMDWDNITAVDILAIFTSLCRG
jgi:hypothetical protein